MKLRNTLLTVALLLLANACTTMNGVSSRLEETRSMTLQGTAFDQALSREYLMIADAEYTAGDMSDALYFYNVRSQAAGAGTAVETVIPSEQGMPSAMESEAEGAKQRLEAILIGGGKDVLPEVTARAQASFDCWVHDWCEMHDGIEDCKDNFFTALTEVETALRPADVPVPQVQTTIETLQSDVNFDFDKATLKPAGFAMLERIANNIIASSGDLKGIEVIGHTDSIGTDDYNQKLSERRAATVADFLISKGIPADKLSYRGEGERQPVADNKTREGRAQNRRVNIYINTMRAM